ncbi:hypothetical protein LCGC14_1953520 [marine sediment metagenome]|uniref:IrrE N-terminal-like domain-containing protein n=1 Tax=marine sediment metagenome TaxID=412755 RepID=A0A0F9IDS7_9ZZZZ
MKRFVLPKKIKYPGGFVIKIVEVALPKDEGANWSYDWQGTGIIQLEEGMTKARQKYYLSHELVHAAIDYHHFMIVEGGMR